jgi:hypothetical protein
MNSLKINKGVNLITRIELNNSLAYCRNFFTVLSIVELDDWSGTRTHPKPQIAINGGTTEIP